MRGTMGADVSTRSTEAGTHLQLLRSLARELERAMQAIAHNDLDQLEDSILQQQDLSARLSALADVLRAPLPATAAATIDENLQRQIQAANGELQKLNLRYSILLQHSSHSVALMASLFRSIQGQFQENSGARLKHETWSCEV